MNERGKVLLVVGSPRGAKSTSMSLGTYLIEKMREKGFETDTVFAGGILKPEPGPGEILSAVDDASVLVIAFPLYVDAIPYPLLKLMELISERRQKAPEAGRLRLLAIANNGFPEAGQNDTALVICRQFARESRVEWVGGLALGGGHGIGGEPLDKRGFLVRNVKKSLNIAAEALVNEKPLSQEAACLMARPLIPNRLYLWFGETGGKRTARRNGVADRINDRPYEK